MGSFSLMQWGIVAVIAFVLYSIFKNNSRPSTKWTQPGGPAAPDGRAVHCMTCGVEAPPISRTRGSIGMEVVLWVCFLVPGLIYSVWRLTTRRMVCSACGAENIIPVQSPAAIAHRQQLAAAVAQTAR